MSPVITAFELLPMRVRNILHLLDGRVLRLVENDERIVERAPTHKRQRSHFDHVALQHFVTFSTSIMSKSAS